MLLPPLQDPVAHRLGWALIHFVWQGALVALLLKLTLVAVRRRSPNLRYLAACGAMLCLVSAPILTSLALPDSSTFSITRPKIISPRSAQETALGPGEQDLPVIIVRVFSAQRAPLAPLLRWLEANLPTLLLIWVWGVTLFTARLCAGWWQVKRLAATGSPLSNPEWNALLARLSERLHVNRPVKLLKSAVLEVPATLGWLRPVVLLPASTLTGLGPDQLEWILAHELAHIRRRDYLVNLLQSAAETLLFYHPAVWWVSAQIRLEREDCCDDMVVAACGNPAGYAGALATLESLRSGGALAIAANGGRLLKRVRRLLGQSPADHLSGAWVLGAAVALAFAIWLTGGSSVVATQIHPEATTEAPTAPPGAADSGKPMAIQAAPPHLEVEVEIEIKFLELTEREIQAVGLETVLRDDDQEPAFLVTNQTGLLRQRPAGTNQVNLFADGALLGVEKVTRGASGVLTEAQSRTVLQAIERRTGVDVLTAPRVTTLSGRQARIEVFSIRNIVTGVDLASKAGEPNVFTPTAIPLGPSLDVIPNVSADGQSIQMTVIPGMTSFVGYDDPGPHQVPGADGVIVQIPLPRFRVRQTLTRAEIPRGHTLVLTGFGGLEALEPAEKEALAKAPKELIIFVKPSVVDSAGTRLPPN